MTDDVDIAVVGAGLSGLACARVLRRAGRTVAVLEADARVGGRTLSRVLGAGRFDLGGQWVGDTQPRVLALARELGVATFATFAEGAKVMEHAGRRGTYRGTIPTLAPWHLWAMQRALWRIEALERRMVRGAVTPELAQAWDAWTLGAWLRRHAPNPVVLKAVNAALRVVFGAEADELSLLFFLSYTTSAGGFKKLIEVKDGAQQLRFAGGAQRLSEGLAAELGDVVRLAAPVRELRQDASGVDVLGDGVRLRARRVVVAAPPALAGRIRYAPALPPERDLLTQRVPMGTLWKFVATYAQAFWRAEGLSGEAVSLDGPLAVTFDDTTEDGRQPALVGFVGGDPARALAGAGPEQRRDAVLAALARLFGPRAAQPDAFELFDWTAQPFVRGAPVGIMPAGVLSRCGDALARPCGRLHWAGTESARTWRGYLEGALEAAERAAQEVLAEPLSS